MDTVILCSIQGGEPTGCLLTDDSQTIEGCHLVENCTIEDITETNRPYSRCQILKPGLVFLNITSYGR